MRGSTVLVPDFRSPASYQSATNVANSSPDQISSITGATCTFGQEGAPVDRFSGPLASYRLQPEGKTFRMGEAVGHVLAGLESEALQRRVQREGSRSPQSGADNL